MRSIFIVGRVVFVLYFIFAGLQRLINFTASADYFAGKIAIPGGLSTLSRQLESLIGLSTPQILALLAGVIQLAAGLLIAFNVGTRAMAVILIIFTGASLYFGNNFWELTDGARDASLAQAMLQISLIGGLIVFAALGASRPGEPERRLDV